MSETTSRTERAANLFDLRRIIGFLFVAWGVLLVILGLAGMGDVENARNINLFAGIGMLALGIVFLLWAFTRPLGQELREVEEEERAAPDSEEASGAVWGDRERVGQGSDTGL